MKYAYILCKLIDGEETFNLHCHLIFQSEQAAMDYINQFKLKNRVYIATMVFYESQSPSPIRPVPISPPPPKYRYFALTVSLKLNLVAHTVWRTDGKTVEWTINPFWRRDKNDSQWKECCQETKVKTPSDLLNTELFSEIV